MTLPLPVDVRRAVRSLVRNPGVTFVAVATVALAIAANATIFGVLYTVLLKPLPFGEPDRLVRIFETRAKRGWNRAAPSEPNFWDLRAGNRTFEEMAAMSFGSMVLRGKDGAEDVGVTRATASFFRVLQVKPVIGRTFVEGEDQPGRDSRVVVLGHDFWRARFGGDPAVLGRSVTLDAAAYTIVGVAPPGEPYLDDDLFRPLVRNINANRGSFDRFLIGRLKRTATIGQARADLQAVSRRLAAVYPWANEGMGVNLIPSDEWLLDSPQRRAIWMLTSAVAFLLLIACVNLANLHLAKSSARQRELAILVALGATRARIARQVIVESAMLGVLGGTLGLLLARWGIDLLKIVAEDAIPRTRDLGLGFPVVLFTGLAIAASILLPSILPAWLLPRGNVVSSMGQGDRNTGGSRSRNRVRSVLVAGEVALSITLLVGAGLLIRSFAAVWQAERGFVSDGRACFTVAVKGQRRLPDRLGVFLSTFLERMRSHPRVAAAAAVSMMPLAPSTTNMGIRAGDGPEDTGGSIPTADWRNVTPDYFKVMGLPVLRGRTFRENERMEDEGGGVIISQAVADRLWPGQDPVGRLIVGWAGSGNRKATVIGVVGNMRERGLERGPTLAVYLPYYGAGWTPVVFVVHAKAHDPLTIVPELRSMLAEIDRMLPMSNVTTLDALATRSTAERRLPMVLLALLSGVALVLTLAGTYGVQAYIVTRRTADIGVRVALGATPRQILCYIIALGMRPALAGLALGLAGAFGVSRWLRSLLYGIGPNDWVTFASAAVLLAAVTALSCYVPARRALRVDPVVALRTE
jgi:putative ABC transport system permease protein